MYLLFHINFYTSFFVFFPSTVYSVVHDPYTRLFIESDKLLTVSDVAKRKGGVGIEVIAPLILKFKYATFF